MQYKLSHLPLVKIVLPLLTGILFFDVFSVSFLTILITTLVLFITGIISHFTITNYLSKKINAIIIYVLIFSVGGLMVINKKFNNQEHHFSRYKSAFAKGIISKPLEEKDRTFKTVISIQQVVDSTHSAKNADGNLLVYIQKDSSISNVEMGDEVLFQLNYKPVDEPKNPGEFDYKNYLKYKSIFQQQYIAVSSITIIHKHQALFIKRISDNIGKYVQSILRKYIPKKEQFALADGILLGHRADIDVDLYNAFAYTGILHILSVSGLHVGIIYGMLLFFLSFIKDKNKKIKIAKFVFIFIFIWMFTFVTGFSAACVRAAILFSLLNFGKLNKEHVSNLNLLAGAALIQLLMDPNNVFDIGFQLSYLAMLGLFIFYKPIYALYYHPNKIVDWTWQLWSASIAAQVFTVPLSIYYFGNFPTYFLFANIFAIPLSAVILWLSMALIPLSFIPFLAKIIGWLDAFIISVFIQLTYFFSDLPFGKLFNLYISKWQLLLLFTAVLCLSLYIIVRKNKLLIACLSLFLVTIFISYYYSIQQLKKDEMILYSVQKNIVLAVNKKNQQYLFSKDSLSEKAFSFSIKNSYRAYRIDEHQQYLLNDSSNQKIYSKNNLVVANNKSFYFLTHDNTRKTFDKKLQIDYLVLSDNCYLNIESVQANFDYKQLVISSDNNYYHQKIYKKLLEENKMQYVDLNEKALVIEL
jgi:competence protein ComEC